MKFTLFASLAAVAAAHVDLDDASVAVEQRFAAFMKTFAKDYSAEDRKAAFEAFKVNDAKVQDYNSRGLTYTLGHNEFSDMMPQDFLDAYVGGYEAADRDYNYDYSLSSPERVAAAPASIDWTTKGAVTPIKNQGQCGSCWAFSTVMGVEGALAVETGELLSLSEQNLVSCDHNGDQGCNGGLMDNAFEFIVTNGGIDTEKDYPYTSGSGSSGTCKSDAKKVVTITAHTDVPQKDEDALKVAVAQQPVSVAIEADKSVFQLYKSGVLTSKECGTTLDHGVGIVGYGTESGTDYWKVKNSWGATWGMDGYILLERGTNECGISQSASYPTGAHKTGSSPSPAGPAPSSPSPAPSTPAGSHYEDPNTTGSCRSDEQDIQIQGITGKFCSPACTGVFKTKCPTDVPAGVTARPECALQDPSGDKYCALICDPSGNGDECGDKASCKSISGTGLCTYDSR